jgi:hypothetical protein
MTYYIQDLPYLVRKAPLPVHFEFALTHFA